MNIEGMDAVARGALAATGARRRRHAQIGAAFVEPGAHACCSHSWQRFTALLSFHTALYQGHSSICVYSHCRRWCRRLGGANCTPKQICVRHMDAGSAVGRAARLLPQLPVPPSAAVAPWGAHTAGALHLHNHTNSTPLHVHCEEDRAGVGRDLTCQGDCAHATPRNAAQRNATPNTLHV